MLMKRHGAELYTEAAKAFESWKKKHPDEVMDDLPFYMVGEVYNYGISNWQGQFDFGDKKVDYYDHGFQSLINFDLKSDAKNSYESTFKKYNYILRNKLAGKGVLNYLTSHDDGEPFDKKREKPYYSANVLLLTPGASQIYYGDESFQKPNYRGYGGRRHLALIYELGRIGFV